MNEIYNKPALNLICPKCGYKLATTRWEEIDLDTTIYAIKVKVIENPLISQIRSISKLIGSNFIVSKKALEEGATVFEGNAIDTKSKVELLKENNIEYIISPEFPY